jgi:hypothetical protein
MLTAGWLNLFDDDPACFGEWFVSFGRRNAAENKRPSLKQVGLFEYLQFK